MKSLIVLDAYNYIFYLHEYKSMEKGYLCALRDTLISDMDEYGKFTGIDIIIVFDGHFAQSGSSIKKAKASLEVIYSKKGQSADSIIERLSRNLKDYESVFVVSSDYNQQKVVFGNNIYRKSIREFRLELDAFKKDIQKKISDIRKDAKNVNFNLIGNKIGKDIRKRFSKQ